jgi:formylglycine-generating enzyme required for sulfatase activity
VERVSLRLPMSCFGVAPDLAASESCDAESGKLAKERVLGGTSSAPVLETASFAPLEERPCTSVAPGGMSCIPGGAFLLGDTQSIAGTTLAPPSVPERLVRLDPFFLDKTELSVGEYRKLVTQAAIPPAAILFPAPDQGCTYLGQTEPGNDELPLNCLDQHQAALVCEASGKRLPTEAEWEFTASGRGLELRYPWGDDDDVCAHAVVARAGIDRVATCMALVEGVSAGVTPVGSWHDVSRDGILDLGGNVSEWVADGSAKYDDACFNPEAQLLENPLCAPATGQVDFAVRGGSFTTIPAAARAAARLAGVSPGYPNVGVRCARSN